MRSFDPAYAAHLASEVTTLCNCWRVVRKDGQVLGFTDHDRPLHMDGQDYAPDSGFSATQIAAGGGFEPDESGVQGLLASNRIVEAEVEAGLFDGALVELYRVNWQDTSVRALIWAGQIGDIRKKDGLFEAVLTGPASLLERSTGRVFSRLCDASFGDARCGLNPADFPPGTDCPRSWKACQGFANTLNFRGFPYLLGEDAMLAGPKEGEPKDGKSRYTHG